MPYCPECLQEFAVSGGYCPHDGTALKAGRAPTNRGEDDALARLQSHGVGVEDVDNEDYDHYLGTKLDNRYKITRKLGEGGMGVVFYAEHVVIEKPVAIKVLKKVVSRDPSVVQRFVQEARAASRIGHPNIVDVTDFGETPDGLAYQVMEYLDGPTLADLIYSEKTLSVSQAMPIIGQIARALASAHEKGIVHRDLKPENVFLIDRHGRHDFVKIVDFGIAKVTSTADGEKLDAPRLTRAGAVFGTPEYMSPEQASGSSKVDHRSDIYSLGAILYEMLVGKVPLAGDNTVRTLAMVILDTVPPPRDVYPDLVIDPKVEAVMMKALAKRKEDRFQSMDAFADALEEATGERLSPKIGRGIGSLPPLPPPSGAAIEFPDTMPEVGEPAAMRGSDDDDGKPTSLYEKKRSRRSRASTFDPPFVETARPGYDAIAEPKVDDLLKSFERKSRAPILIAALIFLGGVAFAGYFVMSRTGAAAEAPEPDAAGGRDAAVAAVAARDAATVVARTADAAVVVDAAATIDARGPNRTTRRKTPENRGNTVVASKGRSQIRVITRPDNARVFVGGIYRGPDGVNLSEPIGSVLNISCKLSGYSAGRVRLRVAKASHVVICDMMEKPRCNPELKTPFGKCP